MIILLLANNKKPRKGKLPTGVCFRVAMSPFSVRAGHHFYPLWANHHQLILFKVVPPKHDVRNIVGL